MIYILTLLSIVCAATQSNLKAAGTRGLFEEHASQIVSIAVEIRSSGVAPSEASSVASVIASKGLMPSQFTQLAKLGENILANEKSIDPQSLLEAANLMASAYTSIHTQASYSSYVDYVKQHSSIFDMEKMGTAGMGDSQKARMGEMQLVSIYESLMDNPNGRNAIHTMTSVMENYARDFNTKARGTWLSQVLFNLV